MFHEHQHELLDFGDGRKLERFGQLVVDRPSPAADRSSKASPGLWQQAGGRFVRGRNATGKWVWSQPPNSNWFVSHDAVSFALKATASGQLGLFPEQARNWDWIAEQLGQAHRPVRVLNLFAYTGGSTFAAAASGAEVVHLDAAKNVVQWARSNAKKSGLETAPIRWIVEDACRFVARERRRGNRYDAIIMDPPSYSHGPRGEVWKIEQLAALLEDCARLLSEQCRFMLLTCHSSGLSKAELRTLVREATNWRSSATIEAETMYLRTSAGRRLDSGEAVFWLP